MKRVLLYAMSGFLLSGCEGLVSSLDEREASDQASDDVLNGTAPTTPSTQDDGSDPVGDRPGRIGACGSEQDVQAVFESYNCTSCHNQSPQLNGGGLDLISDGLAERLIGRPSVNAGCTADSLVDLETPEASIFLRSVDPERYSGFGSERCDPPRMPLFSGIEMAEADVTCLEEWVRSLDSSVVETEELFEGDPLSVATKAKYLLHGGPITAEEFEQVQDAGDGDAKSALRDLVRSWMETDEFRIKLRQFLVLALQQHPGDENYFTQFRNTRNQGMRFVRANLRDSMINTAMNHVFERKDWRRYFDGCNIEATTLNLIAYKMTDNAMILNKAGNWPKGEIANDIRVWGNVGAELTGDDVRDYREVELRHNPNSRHMESGTSLDSNQYEQYQQDAPDFVEELRSVMEGESITLRAPRCGPFMSPAFFQTHMTNVDNDFRLITNQAMIITTGMTFSPGDSTPTNDTSCVDTEEFPVGSECYGCHKNLDMMKNAWTRWLDSTNTRYTADGDRCGMDFSFQGHSVPVNTTQEFMTALANHPAVPKAWTQKVCMWATGAECELNTPELIRIAEVFKESGYDLLSLIEEFFVSSLFTQVSDLEGSTHPGAQVSIARAGHFCHATETRLNDVLGARGRGESNVADICNYAESAPLLSGSIPEDSSPRGSTTFEQPSTMEAFTAVAYEGLCATSALSVVAPGNNGVFDSNDVNETIELMTTHFAGFPDGSSRATSMMSSLRSIYDVSVATPQCGSPEQLDQSFAASSPTCGLGLSPEEAQEALFTMVCQSPALTGLGL